MAISNRNHTDKVERARLELAARVLVVDDDSAVQELLTYILEREGYRVAVAGSGEQALTLLDEFSPDVMLLDYLMPDIDGQELTRQIRARQDMLYVPIVMLTGLSEKPEKANSNRLNSLQSGVDAYLTKPIAPHELNITIRSMLRIKQAQDRMLDALERVAQVQDELLEYERKQGQYEAMRATVAACSYELGKPLESISQTADKLETLLDAELSADSRVQAHEMLDDIWKALHHAQNVILAMEKTQEFSTRELANDTVVLNLKASA
jgi:DNA-binding response OmpR family regulator